MTTKMPEITPEELAQQMDARIDQFTAHIAAKLDHAEAMAANLEAKAADLDVKLEAHLEEAVEKSKEVLGDDLESKSIIADAMLQR